MITRFWCWSRFEVSPGYDDQWSWWFETDLKVWMRWCWWWRKEGYGGGGTRSMKTSRFESGLTYEMIVRCSKNKI